MMDAGRHPNITLLTYSEVEEISGYVGNFRVRVRKKARSVDADKCTGCGECVEHCIVRNAAYIQDLIEARQTEE
jgi:heterodisulfide reductase subunit A